MCPKCLGYLASASEYAIGKYSSRHLLRHSSCCGPHPISLLMVQCSGERLTNLTTRLSDASERPATIYHLSLSLSAISHQPPWEWKWHAFSIFYMPISLGHCLRLLQLQGMELTMTAFMQVVSKTFRTQNATRKVNTVEN